MRNLLPVVVVILCGASASAQTVLVSVDFDGLLKLRQPYEVHVVDVDNDGTSEIVAISTGDHTATLITGGGAEPGKTPAQLLGKVCAEQPIRLGPEDRTKAKIARFNGRDVLQITVYQTDFEQFTTTLVAIEKDACR